MVVGRISVHRSIFEPGLPTASCPRRIPGGGIGWRLILAAKRSQQVQEVVIDHVTGTDQQHGDKTVITSFLSRQSLRLNITQGPNGQVQIDGPVDAIRWDDIERLARVAREALVRAGVFDESSLMIRASLESLGGRWNPKISLVTEPEHAQESAIRRTRDVVPTVLDCLVRGGGLGTPPIDKEIDEEQMQVIDAVATDALAVCGGRALQAEVLINVCGDAVAKVAGKFGPKPDRSNFSALAVDLCGEFVGFHLGGEVLYFIDDLKGEIKLAFGRTQVDLLQVTRLIMDKQKVEVRVHRTINKSGAELLAFVAFKGNALDVTDRVGG